MIRDVRDVAIIVLAVQSIVVGGLMVFLIIQLMRLMKMLREEIKPILESTNETVSTVRGTTTFMSEHLVSPLVRAASFFSGLKRGAQVATGWPKARSAPPAEATVSGAQDNVNGSIAVEKET
jgi:hypothetical protein